MGAGLLIVPSGAETGGAARVDAAASSTISGEVFIDFDRDGRPDRGERARNAARGVDVTITNIDDEVRRTTTDGSGMFSVEVDPARAPYRVDFDTPVGFQEPFAQPIDERDNDVRTSPATNFVDVAPALLWYGMVPDSRCPDQPVDVGFGTARFPDGAAHSALGKIWTTCFVDGAADSSVGASDVLVGANYDASGWNPSDGAEFGGNVDVEHLGTKQQMGSVWGVANDEWDGWLFTSAVIKRHSGLGPEGVDGLYWLDVNGDGVVPEVSSASLDAISPSDAPSFGADPRECPVDLALFDRAQTGRGGLWDCRDVGGVDAGGESYDWWAFDRTGRDGIGDIDTTPSGDELLVMNATADALFVYDIANLSADEGPTYRAHYPIDDPGCADGEFEAWGVSAIDAASAYVGVTCTASTSNSTSELASHVVLVEFGDDAIQESVVRIPHEYIHGAGYTDDTGPTAGNFQPWIAPDTPGGPPSYPDVADAAGIEFRDFVQAYAYSNAWDWHQPLLSDIEVDPVDGSLVVAVMDRWAMMTGLFNCDLDPTEGGCGTEIPAPPAGDYDGEPGDDPVEGYTAPITAYVAGDLLRICNVTDNAEPTFEVEGDDDCEPTESPEFEVPFGGGPAGSQEWYWGDQAFGDDALDSPHPETAQGAVFIGHRRSEAVFTAITPSTSFGAGWTHIENRTGTPVDDFQLFRTEFRDSDGTGWKGASVGDIEACIVPIEIGNAVWFDRGLDGDRDVDDPGIAGVRIGLVRAETGEEIARTFTDDDGHYYFGTLDGLEPLTDYQLMVDIDTATNLRNIDGGLPRLDLAPTEADASDDERLDSDGIFDENGNVVIEVTTGHPGSNDHTFGIGYVIDRDGQAGANADEEERQGPPTLRTFAYVGLGLLVFGLIAALILRLLWGKPPE